jgi:hypothetical protein
MGTKAERFLEDNLASWGRPLRIVYTCWLKDSTLSQENIQVSMQKLLCTSILMKQQWKEKSRQVKYLLIKDWLNESWHIHIGRLGSH